MDPLFKILVFLTAVNVCQPFEETNLVWVVRNTVIGSPSIVYVPGDPTNLMELTEVNNVTFEFSTAQYIHSLGFHHSAGYLYYSVLNPNQFRAVNISALDSVEYHVGYGDSLQIAVDWSVKNLYWVDGPYRWIAMKPMASKDPHDFKIVVEGEVAHAISLAIDSTKGYMYWGEQSNIPMIKRARLDGSEIDVLAYGGIFAPICMTADVGQGRIYWGDTTKDTVETVDWNGENRKIIWGKRNHDFRGIAFYKDILYVTDIRNSRLMKIKAETGETEAIFDVDKYGSPRGVVVYAAENQPTVADPCEAKKCSHFCFPTGSSGQCACQDGFTLDKDGRSCTGFAVYSPRLLSYANKTHICFLNITIIDGHVPVTPYCPVNNGTDIRDTTQDSANQIVYYSDRKEKAIYSLSLKTGMTNIAVANAGDAAGLAFDWLTSTLYWADSATGDIKSYNVSSGENATVFTTSPGVTQLAIDPFTKKIFWIGEYKILSREYTGGEEETISSFFFSRPSSIYVDSFANRVYWVQPAVIRSATLNGTDYKSEIYTLLYRNGPLVMYKSLAIWASMDDTGVYINTGRTYSGRRHKERSIDTTQLLVDLEVIDTALQRFNKDVCYQNGGCDHYCITKQGKKMCACELGYDLQSDQRSCSLRTITGIPVYLTDSMEDRLFRVDMNSSVISGTEVRNEQLIAIAADWKMSKLYWSDIRASTLRVAGLNASSPSTLVDTYPHFVEDIAVDQETGKIYGTYYSSRMPNYIAVASPDGKTFTKLVTNVTFARAIALHSPKFKMFWSNLAGDISIESSDMDGKHRQTLIKTNISSPNAIAVDVEEDVLFWADGSLDKIERCSLDAKTRKVIFTEPGIHLISIALHGEFLFYIGWNSRSIQMIKKLDGSSRVALAASPKFGRLEDMLILAPYIPPKRPTGTTGSTTTTGPTTTTGSTTTTGVVTKGRTATLRPAATTGTAAKGPTATIGSTATTAGNMTTGVTSTTTNRTGGPAVSAPSTSNEGGVIAGIVVSIFAACVIIAVVVFFVLRRKKRAEDLVAFNKESESVSTPPAFGSTVGYDTLQEEMSQPTSSC